ncbi:DNA-directed RNA polymerase II largest chain, partial [Aphelenchoides avenae]
MRAVGSENAVRPSEAVPAGPPQPDGLHEPALTRKPAQRGPGVQQSVKQEVASQATTHAQATSPTGNRRSTDSGIGLDATPPSRPLAGPQSTPDRPHGQLLGTPNGPQPQNSGLQQRPVGPLQQTSGPHQQTTGPQQQTSGPHHLTSGPHHHVAGPHQHSSVHHQQPVGPHPHMFGAQQLTSGPHQHMFGPQQHTTGPHQLSDGPSRQMASGPHQAAVGPPGTSHLRAILERPPGPPAASTRHQGPPQVGTPAQNAIPGGPQWQTVAHCVAPPLDRLNGWLPPSLTPIWTSPLICHIQGTCEYVEVAANAATGAPVFSLPNHQFLQNAVANYNRVHQPIQAPRQQTGRGPQQPTLQQQQPRSSTRRAAPRRVTLADIPALAPCVGHAAGQPATAPQPGPSDSSRQHAVQNVQPAILDALVDPQQFAQ